ncbi:hypothetical protein ACJJTC_007852 [Scirpophaga incertulas]
MAANTNRNSIDTILTFENRNGSQWSQVLSTAHVPGMDTAMGGGWSGNSARGRRRLRVGTLALGAFLAMHCRVTAFAITGGFFLFIMFLIMAVALLANPLRHYEIYLGQWSISGPGRAFRIIPMFEGIGIAICINAIVRAITCCTIASIAALYVLHSVADARLPFTFCRNFDLISYQPEVTYVKSYESSRWPFHLNTMSLNGMQTTLPPVTIGFDQFRWRNRSLKTVEAVHFRPDFSFKLNIPLSVIIVIAWAIIWAVMLSEWIYNGRLVWNNMDSWFVVFPCLWTMVMIFTAFSNINSVEKIIQKAFKLNTLDTLSALADALQVAMYIHSASTGTEIIHGKGLNHYVSGHIDPQLNAENVWHSGLVLVLAIFNIVNATVCALVDLMHTVYEAHESTLWIIPLYSKCASKGNYSHFLSTLIFAGLTFSYIVVAYSLLKTALHTIFEYRVKLVFVEQIIVGLLIIFCMGLSLLFATNGGIALLESVDALASGVAAPLLCLQELAALLWLYRGSDFISDIHVATEDNTCSTRISTQWQIIPFVLLLSLVLKVSVIARTELPQQSLYAALLPLAVVIAAVPVRAACKAYYLYRASKLRKSTLQ